MSLLTTNHANTGGARGLPPVFGALVRAIAFLSLDIGLALPGSGCLVGRFEDQLMIETVGFIAILVLLVLAYFYSRAKNQDDAWIQLRRCVDVSRGGLLEATSRARTCLATHASRTLFHSHSFTRTTPTHV